MSDLAVLPAGAGSQLGPSGVADEPATITSGQLTSRVVFGGGYLLAAAVCVLVLPTGHGFSVIAPAVVTLCLVGNRVRLWQSKSWVTCVQAAFVLLVFAVPLNVVPLALLVVEVAGLPGKGRRPLMKVAVGACNSWFGFAAPVLLALLAPGSASWDHWAAYVAVFAGQFLAYQVILAARCRLAGVRMLLSERLAGLRVEICLTPVGLAAAIDLHRSPVGALALMLGVTGMLVLVGQEHQQRWVQTDRALRDPLTQLPNRALFDETAATCESRCRRKNEHAGLLLIDLDEFKPINDTFGHKAGDEVLCAFADHLRTNVRAVDLPARVGGDEFAVVLAEPMDLDGAREVADKLKSRLAKSIKLASGHEVSIGFSTGFALFGDEISLHDAAVQADSALYEDKRSRKPTNSDRGRI
jgi:diguanylate cyclase (GGDEF)-like protein